MFEIIIFQAVIAVKCSPTPEYFPVKSHLKKYKKNKLKTRDLTYALPLVNLEVLFIHNK
jgi:hypothetical protein